MTVGDTGQLDDSGPREAGRAVPLAAVRQVLLTNAPGGGRGDPPLLAPDTAMWFRP
ncbi:hypothetical protein ACFY2R_20405 [Micromonospora olivasterospora]|uniref:hypothetical protein n=1 Tax=Micromonospora olivasterospora TaxID=1880 RepID=UPI001478E986|nr:hypothetical protein [Micromonospora olivasterospora]